ncbi:MAG: hypothetical protein KAQ98_03890 [Bacteriovoracaceae bacterium]|nr:hypothetical protein [Bacteriovoracaceae bacterium]
MKKYSPFLSVLLLTIFVSSCASKPVNILEQQEGIQIVEELPSNLKCKNVGEVEVKDILESSAREELKTSVRELGGNHLIIVKTLYRGSFVIHTAQGFNCE